ncbi:Crp/Fnr family transcriptional regulator [Fibrella aquatilis]|uniref:Crp/Fnr family transcriptional regulator n=1 Tax=Fibrella aquatilis TaxID=2817059 RepID=A0A939G675_9BACT|nr:Crp/Fnr family transcriptional regulator [Fibrella aquatilis]MBO0931948.1 Crp/Fnr family transcriptional regulator [Fibrella aquatilis]
MLNEPAISHHKLLQLVNELVPLDAESQTLIQSLFRPVFLPRHTRLVEPGQIARQLYFINAGYVRVSTLEDGEEVTTHLNCPPGFITSFESFTRQEPATNSVECLTDSALLAITRPDLDLLYAHSHHLTEFGRLIFEQSIRYNEQRIKDLMVLTAEQRYLKLLRQHPSIIQNVPLQHIASFIGIKPESLSRIRRQIIS